jgi:C-terminal processing protease CtpA/Prc
LIVLALQQAGNGWIVAQGPISNRALVFRQSVSIGSNYEARIRTSELILEKKAFGLSLGEELLTLTPDAEVQADVDRGDAGPAMKAALGLIRGTQQSSRATLKKAAVAAPKPVFAPDNPYREMHDPDLEHRLLALFRFWNIIHFFYPYQHLMDEPWDNVLPRFIPRFESAAGAREYQLAIAELATFVPDGHTSVGGTEIAKLFGVPAPVFLSRVEGRPIVTGFLDESVAKTAGLKKGDEILTVDGRPLEQALEALAKYVTASTPEQIDYKKLSVVLGGPPDSNARLSVRGADGETREIELPRRVDILKAYYGAAHTDEQVFHVLPGNIGYAVLEWLKPEKVDAMFEAFEGTKAIIFDLRGYPQWTAWSIAPRLSARSGPAAAVFRRNLVTGKNPTDVYQFTQPLPTTTKSKYTGKVVTLINQRAISRSEYTGLFFEVACNTTFIGSRTAGANGDVTDFILPGNIRVGFTGHDVRHADGRQLQRVGLIPQIEVKPTIAGVRAGRDEVLERAIQFIEKGN